MQRLKRYQAPTREDAYDRIRDECGTEVDIVSTRNVRMPGLFGAPEREYVEVVVRVSDEDLERRRQLAARLAAARAEAHAQRANDAARARTARVDPYDEFDADGEGFDDATVTAAELAAAIAGENAAAGDAPGLAPEFANEFAGSGIVPDHLLPSDLAGALPTGNATRDDAVPADPIPWPLATDGSADGTDGSAEGPADGPFGAINAAAMRAAHARDAAEEAMPWAHAAAQPEPAIGAAEFRALTQQVGELKTLLRGLMLDRRQDGPADAPGALAEARARLLERGVSATVATPTIEQAADALPRNPDEASALRTVERKLAAQLPAVPRVDFARRPVLIFLVGPAGAGKTTLAVRLALDIRAHAMSATVAGTDVGRAGGPQQITAMGAATGVPVQLCYSPGELQALVNEGGSDVVIVDTPGHTGARRDRMTELEAFMHATRRRHTLLVLPATMQAADLSLVTKAYQPLALDGLVITRCDETEHFGGILSTAAESGLGIAYTTHSDGVSVAPRGGDNLMLARAVVAGRWPEPAPALPRTHTPRAARTAARAGSARMP